MCEVSQEALPDPPPMRVCPVQCKTDDIPGPAADWELQLGGGVTQLTTYCDTAQTKADQREYKYFAL